MAKNIKIRLDRHVMHTISFFSLIMFHTQYNIQIYFYIMENIKLKKKLPEKPAPQRGHRRWPRAGHGGASVIVGRSSSVVIRSSVIDHPSVVQTVGRRASQRRPSQHHPPSQHRASTIRASTVPASPIRASTIRASTVRASTI